jgi:TrpR-related protein YerC/YecD
MLKRYHDSKQGGSDIATNMGGGLERPDWRTEETTALIDSILRLENREEAERFFRDLCTLGELHDLSQRWAVVRLLDDGLHYAEISQQTGASTATITRIASWLQHGEGGYRLMLERTRGGRLQGGRRGRRSPTR